MNNLNVAVNLLVQYATLRDVWVDLSRAGIWGEDSIITETLDTLSDSVLDLIGIPQNSIDFCRDWFDNELFSFEISNELEEDNDQPDIFLQNLVYEYEKALSNERTA